VVREWSHDSDDNDDTNLYQDIVRLESPLQPHYVANDDLQSELAVSQTGQSVLRQALPVAPLSILRLLIHLGPQAVRHVNVVNGRMLVIMHVVHGVNTYRDVSVASSIFGGMARGFVEFVSAVVGCSHKRAMSEVGNSPGPG
jgi:hypothetical protein